LSVLALNDDAASHHVSSKLDGAGLGGFLMEITSQNVTDEKTLSERETHAAGRTEPELRSGYGMIPGAELPVAVYVSVFAAFAWIVLASWLAFANDADADLSLGIAGVLTVVFFALPVLIRLTAMAHPRARQEKPHDFLASRVETATGTLSGASAWLQIVLIPAALALAATLIGATSLLVH